jgi:hypothetical protein
MKHLAALLLALSAAFGAHAQAQPEAPASAAAASGLDEAGERARIRTEKAAAEKRLKDSQVACRARFAVTDCTKAADREYNATVGELRRQERVLNEAERKRRAAAHQKELDERNAPERRAEDARKRAEALAEQGRREASAAERAAKKEAEDAKKAATPGRVKTPSGHAGPQGTPRAPREAKSHGPTPEEAARNRAAYEERLQAAQRHLAEAQERAARRGRPAASALPEPK